MADGEEVARFKLPMPVKNIERLSSFLEDAYGKGLLMHQDGEFLIITRPA